MNKKTTGSFGRRALLKGGAGLCLSLPFFESLRASANETSGPTQFVAIIQPTVLHLPLFLPYSGGRTPWAEGTPPRAPYATGVYAADDPIGDFTPVNESLAPYRDQLLFVEGLHAGHKSGRGGQPSEHGGYSRLLLGTPSGDGDFELGGEEHKSLDQRIADHIGGSSRVASLQTGIAVKGTGELRSVSWVGPGQAAPTVTNHQEIWKRLFADFSADPAAVANLQAQRLSVLDAALDQAESLRTSLSRHDQDKLDQYLAVFRDVELRLETADAPADCTPIDEPLEGGLGWNDGTEMNMDMLALALACGITRVGTFQMGEEGHASAFSFLGNTHGLHHISHDYGKEDHFYQQLVRLSTWTIEKLAYFLSRLDDFGILESTLTAFMCTMNTSQHNSSNIPYLLAGGGGALRTGRHIRLPMFNSERDAEDSGGTIHGWRRPMHYNNDALVTMGQLFGLDLESIGDPDWNRRPLTELLA